jgi:hypothetical protein
VDLLEKESVERIEEIWLEYFKDKDNISAVVPSDCYEQLSARFSHCPIFVVPWEQSPGQYVPVFFLAKGNTHCFTLVSDLKANPDTCPPQLVVHWFTDLFDTKNIVLLKGDLVGRTFSPADGQYLVGVLQIFYLNDEWYEKFVMTCNHSPDKFVYADVVKMLFRGEESAVGGKEEEAGSQQAAEEEEEGEDMVLSMEDLMKLEKGMQGMPSSSTEKGKKGPRKEEK